MPVSYAKLDLDGGSRLHRDRDGIRCPKEPVDRSTLDAVHAGRQLEIERAVGSRGRGPDLGARCVAGHDDRACDGARRALRVAGLLDRTHRAGGCPPGDPGASPGGLARHGIGRDGIAALGHQGDGRVRGHGVGPGVPLDAARRAVAPSDLDRHDERPDPRCRLRLVPGRLTDEIRVLRPDARRSGARRRRSPPWRPPASRSGGPVHSGTRREQRLMTGEGSMSRGRRCRPSGRRQGRRRGTGWREGST